MNIKLLTLIAFIGLNQLQAQSYPKLNINLVGHLDTETVTVSGNQKYSGCWGWNQDSTTKGSVKVYSNKEYAIVGSVAGTYFIDISAPATPTVCDYVKGKTPSTWRELKTYKNYCYVVSDVVTPNTFQIIDMQYLPDSVHVVYEGTSLFERGHTCWVDNDKLYVGGATLFGGTARAMLLFSLATPTAPVLLRSLHQDYPSISYVHDMFVRNDTIYASAGYQGLHVYRLTGSNTFTSLGSLTSYPESGYNHSSYITDNGKYLVFCDEVPANLSIKLVDVTNKSNITPLSLFRPNLNAMMVAHNPYVKGNKWAFVSCYQDGLYVYDISSPGNPVVGGYFDTYPQGGDNAGNNYGGGSYAGNWGAYPYFKSGLILACDMQNGVFILEANNLLGIGLGVNSEEKKNHLVAGIYPNPSSFNISVYIKDEEVTSFSVEFVNLMGQTVLVDKGSKEFGTSGGKNIDVSTVSSGLYYVKVQSGTKSYLQKIMISH